MTGRGLGSVYKTQRGTFRAETTIAGERITKTYPTRALAKEWLAAMLGKRAEFEREGYGPGLDADITVERAAENLLAYFEAGADRVRSKTTLKGYRLLLRAIVEHFGARRVAAIREADVTAWVADMRRAGLSTNSIRHRLDRLAQLFKLAVSEGWIPRAPFTIKRPKLVLKSERDVISEPDFAKLLEAAQGDPRAVAALLLAGDAGLRRAEIARLDGSEIDFERGLIHVAVRSESDRTKSGKGRRVPILTARLRAALAALDPQPGRPVLINVTHPDSLTGLLNPTWKRAGLGDYSHLHRLRHRFVTRLLDAGEPAISVQRWVGHSDLKTTLGYAHPSEVPTAAASAALDFHPEPTRPAAKGPRVVSFNRSESR